MAAAISSAVGPGFSPVTAVTTSARSGGATVIGGSSSGAGGRARFVSILRSADQIDIRICSAVSCCCIARHLLRLRAGDQVEIGEEGEEGPGLCGGHAAS